MSVKTSLISIRIPIKPGNQTANYQSFVTYLNTGAYVFTYNYAFKAIAGNLTSTQGIVTCIAPYGSIGFQEICASPKTGPMGTPGTSVFAQSLQNNVFIVNDNTPIYVSLFMTLTAFTTWTIPTGTNYNDNMNYISIIKVG